MQPLCKDGVSGLFLPCDELLFAIEPLLPEPGRKPEGRGRPPVSPLLMFCAVYYVLRTGIPWKALPPLPRQFLHRTPLLSEMGGGGVFHSLWKLGLLQAQFCEVLNFSFMSMDGAMTKAPLGGEHTEPSHRQKQGRPKRHLLTEANGLPVGLTVTGANVHDITQVGAVLESMPFLIPDYEPDCLHGFCADKVTRARR